MTRKELLDYLVSCARVYHKGAMKSIIRNNHMNEVTGNPIDQRDIDALLVDFINFIGSNQGLDLGLYTKDLREPICTRCFKPFLPDGNDVCPVCRYDELIVESRIKQDKGGGAIA